MSKGLALLWAVIGTILLAGIGYAISVRSVWLVLLFALASFLFIGVGFITKARLRRKKQD